MKLTILESTKKTLAALLMVIFVLTGMVNNAYAIANEGVRGMSWVNRNSITIAGNTIDMGIGSHPHYKSDSYHCTTEAIDFNPFSDPDMQWEMDNAVCLSYFFATGTVNLSAQIASHFACNNAAEAAQTTASQAVQVPMNPALLKAALKDASACSLLTDPVNKAKCCGGVAIAAVTMASAISALAIIWEFAKDTHENARICGRNWNTWEQPRKNDGTLYGADDPDKPPRQHGTLGDWIGTPVADSDYKYENYNGSYAKYLSDKNAAQKIEYNITNREFRELIYGGIEYESNGMLGCENPDWGYDDEGNSKVEKILGYTDSKQRYYMKGPGQAANYACERFIIASNEEDRKKGQASYECCLEASKKGICIEDSTGIEGSNGYEYKFCKLGGSRCKVKNVWFDIYEAKKHPNYICAKTYSVCPFNHLLGGGTETADIDDEGNLINECQYLKHCSKIAPEPYIRSNNMEGGYISGACYDLKGDSQNTYSYNNSLVEMSNNHFSAPMAQCFHETLYNIFLHKAGHVQCIIPSEIPDENGECPGGTLKKVGETLDGSSFFQIIQDQLRLLIKLVLTAAIMMIGFTILMGGSMMARKDITAFVIKVALVMYFALGGAWQQVFFTGVFNTSMAISDIFTRTDKVEAVIVDIVGQSHAIIEVENLENLNDGDIIKINNVPEIPQLNNRQFIISHYTSVNRAFRINTRDPNTGNLIPFDGTGFNDYTSRGTLSLPKKLDGCQFPKFNHEDITDTDNPSYPPGKSYLRIWDTLDCKIVRALGFTPGLSVPHIFMLILAGFLTGGAGIIFLFAAAIFVFHLLSIAVRALHMFLLSSIAIVLMIYISPITITTVLFKRTSSMFKKWYTNLIGFVLQPFILFAYLGIMITIFDSTIAGDITYRGDGITGPKTMNCNSTAADDSLYCILGELGIKTNNIRALGIGLPELDVLNPSSGRLKAIILTMIKAAFLMFIFSSFFGKISSFAANIVGGKSLETQGIDVGKAMGAAYKGIRGVQKRGMRAGIKGAKGVGRAGLAAGRGAKAVGKFAGSKGRRDGSAKDNSSAKDTASNNKPANAAASKPENKPKK